MSDPVSVTVTAPDPVSGSFAGTLDPRFAGLVANAAVGDGLLWGHSYTQTNTDSAAPGMNVDGVLAQLLGARVQNLGLSSVASHDPSNGFGRLALNVPFIRATGPDLPQYGFGVGIHGINDLVYTSDGSVLRNYYRMFASVVRASRLLKYNDAAVSDGGSGSWSSLTPNDAAGGTPAGKPKATYGEFGGNYGHSTIKYDTTVGGTVTLTVPSDYDGGGAITLLIPVEPYDLNALSITATRSGSPITVTGSDEASSNVVTVDARKATQPEYTAVLATNGMLCKRLTTPGGFQAGDVLVFTSTSVSSQTTDGGGSSYSGYAAAFRWNAVLLEASPIPPVFLANIPHLQSPATWSAQGTHLYPESDARADIFNAQIDLLVDEFADGRVLAWDTNTVLNAKAGLFGDTRHWNRRGIVECVGTLAASWPRLPIGDQAGLALATNGGEYETSATYTGMHGSLVQIGSNLGGFPGGMGSRAAPWLRASDGMVFLGGSLGATADIAAGATILTIPKGARWLPKYSAYFGGFDSLGNFVQFRVYATEGTTGFSTPGAVITTTGIANGAGIDLESFGMRWRGEL